ncbi:MAG: LysR family transcriptional regulator [Myxococcota bacterium]
MKIRDMELLVRVAESGSMTLAAQQLRVTPAAVSAAVQRIEASLDLRVFERTTRALHVTDEGARIVDGCLDVVERWQRAVEGARTHRGGVAGTVRLSAPADTTYQVLDAVVVAVCAAHPSLRVIVDTSDAVKHVHGDAIDMAIRYGALPDSTLFAKKHASFPTVLVASPTYLEAAGAPQRPAELQEHRCLTLQLSGEPTARWHLFGRGTDYDLALDRAALCGDGFLARRWALAGVGIAFKSLFDVIDDLERGTLVRVLPDYAGEPMPIHAVFPSRRFLPGRVRALDAAVGEAFAARARRCRAWLEHSAS